VATPVSLKRIQRSGAGSNQARDAQAVKVWEDGWDTFIPFLAFGPTTRKLLYTTNAIESLNYQLVNCIFCGLTRPTSVGDVISKWVRYALNPTSSVTVRAEPGEVTAHMQHMVVTLHSMVCEVCNNGWMHDLEERAKPFLKPLLTNKHGADLDLTQQRDLARWAVMKGPAH
jgi:hypothetical protein